MPCAVRLRRPAAVTGVLTLRCPVMNSLATTTPGVSHPQLPSLPATARSPSIQPAAVHFISFFFLMKDAVSWSIYVATFLSIRYTASALLIALDVPHQLQFTSAHFMFNFPVNSLLYIWLIYLALYTYMNP